MEETSRLKKLEAFEEIVMHLSRAVASRVLYSLGHPTVLETIKKAHQALVELLKKEKELSLGLIKNELFLEDISLHSKAGVSFKGLIEHLEGRDVERISFSKGLKIEELK